MANPEPRFVKLLIGTVATTATATASIDTLGYDFMNVYWVSTSINPTGNTPGTLTLSENTSAATGSMTTLSAATSSLNTPGATNTEYSLRWDVDLEGVERYVIFSCTPADTNNPDMAAVAVLNKGDEAPVSTTDANVETIIRV